MHWFNTPSLIINQQNNLYINYIIEIKYILEIY